MHWQDLPPLPDTFLGGTGQALVDSDKVILGFANGRFAETENNVVYAISKKSACATLPLGARVR